MMERQKFKRRMTMTIAQTPENFAGQTLEAATRVQQNFAQLAHAYQHFMKGLMNVAAQQIELGKGMMDSGVEDFDLLAQARTPEALVQAELEVFRRRSERAVLTTQKITDELRQTWVEAFELVQSIGKANGGPAWAPVQQPVKTAA
jgi:Phasin protein